MIINILLLLYYMKIREVKKALQQKNSQKVMKMKFDFKA